MDSKRLYYTPSGIIPPAGIVYEIAIGIFATAILSVIYGYATSYIPFIYLNVLLTVGYGAGIGIAIGFGGKQGNVRNHTFTGIVAAIFGILGVYAAWVVWIYASSHSELFIYHPSDLLSFAQYLAREGAWSVGSLTPKGLLLYGVWALEALMIIGIAFLVAREFLRGQVYCERCARWIEHKDEIKPLSPIENPIDLKTQLELGNFSQLTALRRVPEESSVFTIMSLIHCPRCRNIFLLNLSSVSIKQVSKNKQEKKQKELIRNLLISPEVYESLKKVGA